MAARGKDGHIVTTWTHLRLTRPRGLELSRRRLLQLAGTAEPGGRHSRCLLEAARCNSTSSSASSPPQSHASAMASPPPAPATTPPGVSPASTVVLCREAWGALPPRPGGTPHTLNRMTIHHTAVVLGDNANAPARLRQHQHYHQDTQGWIDIAYHISVDRNGNIYRAARSASRRRHRDKLRPHRPLPRRMRRKLRRRGRDGGAAQRRRARVRLGGRAIRYLDRDARWTPGREPRHLLPRRQPLRPRHFG